MRSEVTWAQKHFHINLPNLIFILFTYLCFSSLTSHTCPSHLTLTCSFHAVPEFNVSSVLLLSYLFSTCLTCSSISLLAPSDLFVSCPLYLLFFTFLSSFSCSTCTCPTCLLLVKSVLHQFFSYVICCPCSGREPEISPDRQGQVGLSGPVLPAAAGCPQVGQQHHLLLK